MELLTSNLRRPDAPAPDVDARGLEEALRKTLRGEVRFDDGSRALYATDASNYRQVPIGVVLPRDAEDVLATLEACRRFGAPVLGRGGGTSLAGQCCNVAVVVDMSRYMNRVLEIDPARRIARVQPGVVLDDLRRATERHHLTFGPDPASHVSCTFGGMIGNNSCGVHSVMAGKTDDNVEELEVVTYDGAAMRTRRRSEQELSHLIAEESRRGDIHRRLKALAGHYGDLIRARFPPIPRRVSGYNLPWLLPENGFDIAKALVGSESTCILVLEATVRLVSSPPARALLVLGFPDIYEAAEAVPEVLRTGPIGLEGLDERLVQDMTAIRLNTRSIDMLPPGKGWLFAEFGGEDAGEAAAKARACRARLGTRAASRLVEDPKEQRLAWRTRESALGATAHVSGRRLMWEGWEDSAVPPERLAHYLRDLRALWSRYGYDGALYGHFGQGCVHARNDFDFASDEGRRQYRAFLYEAADLVVSYGGSLSGEHGDGQSRAELLPKMFGDELIAAFREFKAIWDPDGRMNPGKLVDAYGVTDNLRHLAGSPRKERKTHFRFPADGGSFDQALLRCVGVGECRRVEGGTMCPSYMATREEKHSTRGRARLLFEMLRGESLKGGWRDESVKEALDLCLSCKGCKSDCPVSVDMAMYKAEFLSHYYEGRLRPRAAYAMGLIHLWARAGSVAPAVANFFTQTPGLSSLARALAGIAPARRLPPFARETFRAWFARRPLSPPGGEKPRVILWPDTFNDNFRPETARAAVEVLEAAGWQIVLPREHLCCGRPLYDHGMLDLAKRLLRRTLESLRPDIDAGTPIVVLEPSCATVFRDELVQLFPEDDRARRLSSQTFLLSELLQRKTPGFSPPRLGGRALVQAHCHQGAVLGLGDEEAILGRLGLEVDVPNPGCCGMAGSFGFEREHYELSRAVGERALIPAVRNASPDTLLIADGFSCREQIEQSTGRRALHLAEVLQKALRQ